MNVLTPVGLFLLLCCRITDSIETPAAQTCHPLPIYPVTSLPTSLCSPSSPLAHRAVYASRRRSA